MNSNENQNKHGDSSQSVRTILLEKYIKYVIELDNTRIQELQAENSKQSKSLALEKQACKDFNIIWGYYVLLNKQKDRIEYFVSKEQVKEANIKNYKSFREFAIRHPNEGAKIGQVHKSVLDDQNVYFSTNVTKTPKFYHHLPPFRTQFVDFFQNTYLADELKDDFTVVLAEEILFFLFLRHYVKQKGYWEKLCLHKVITRDESDIYPHLIQLIKYSMSLESMFELSALHEKFGLNDRQKNWRNRASEPRLRERIESAIILELNSLKYKPTDVKKWFEIHISPKIETICEVFLGIISDKVKNTVADQLDVSGRIEFVSRCNLDTSEMLLAASKNQTMHDYFVFPLVENFEDPYTTRLPILQNNEEKNIKIYHPFLLCTYIDTLYEIHPQRVLDEDLESLDGFKVTELMCQHISKPMVESIYYGEFIEGQKRIERLKTAIATIMGRNLSHTDGSHVMPTFESRELEIGKQSKFWKDIPEFINYNNYLRDMMEYVADISGGLGNQSKIAYIFEDIANNLNDKYLGENFLGMGLIDSKEWDKNARLALESQDNLNTEVSLPGGQNGISAIFTIVKNFIRNQYKHSSPNRKGCYTAKWRIKSAIDSNLSADYYEINIWDSGPPMAREKASSIIKKIKEHIDQNIIEKDGKVRNTGWGILEMKISSAYLIGFPLDHIDDNLSEHEGSILVENVRYPSNILEPYLEQRENGYSIGYKFHLLKPKFCLIRCNHCLDVCPLPFSEKRIYESKGIYFSKQDEEYRTKENFQFVIHQGYGKPSKHNFRIINKCMLPLNKDTLEEFKVEAGSEWIKNMFASESRLNIKTNPEPKLENIEKKEEFYNNLKINAATTAWFDNHANIGATKTHDELKMFAYYEAFDSKSNVSRFLKVVPQWELLETIHTKIAIVDERIQQGLSGVNTLNPCMTKWESLRLKGIYVPEIGNNEEELTNERYDIKKVAFGLKDYTHELLLRSSIVNYFKGLKCNYVIVHLSALESVSEDLDKLYADILEEAELKSDSNTKYLILTSGKGTPATLPLGSYFVNLTTLEKTLEKNSKYELVKLLNSIRRSQKVTI